MDLEDSVFADAAARGAMYEMVEHYGAAAAEDLKAFDGIDHTGIFGGSLKRILQSIAGSHLGVNDIEKARNIHQQAGFSAEVIETTRKNKVRIIVDEKIRSARMDDLGFANDRLVDSIDFELGPNGEKNLLENTARQMKFIGKNTWS